MLATQHQQAPEGSEWLHEVKYDGYRCIAIITEANILLQSRNGRSLNQTFPEVVDFLNNLKPTLKHRLPIILDGELTILLSSKKADFETLQKRGKTKTANKITELSLTAPATLLVFDLLEDAGNSTVEQSYVKRKEHLRRLLSDSDLPLKPSPTSELRVQYLPYYDEVEFLWNSVQSMNGEGLVSKRKNSTYHFGKRSGEWIKVKNFKVATCFITSYEKGNGYFHVGVFNEEGTIINVGLFSHGLSSEERKALLKVIRNNRMKEDTNFLYLSPGICVDLNYLELYQGKLRHPEFKQFRFDFNVGECLFSSLFLQELPPNVVITNPKKPLWDKPLVTKQDYLHFLLECSPLLLPFIKNRHLTVIRFPHGMNGESFYQKNTPDYAPSFVQTDEYEGNLYTLCNNLDTLIWLGNQLALEFHVPYQTIDFTNPSEIVFDLDPPSQDYFSLAVIGALKMKEIFDTLKLSSFVKTSGRKGLQVYIPLPENKFTYEETRRFTEFIASYLVKSYPEQFTIERLKKNRGKRVYLDYIQHAAGKTIVAPYSLRENVLPTVATPLYWEEVKEELLPEAFTIFSVMDRINNKMNPFRDYWTVANAQTFRDVLTFLNGKDKV